MDGKDLKREAILLTACRELRRPALAYLDAGTGAMIIQMLAAAVFGLGFVLRSYWGRIKAYFKPAPKEDADSEL